MFKQIRNFTTWMLAAAAFAGAGQTFAQTDADSGLNEVIVTAQRRSESLQDVPMSVAAFDSEYLAKSNVVRLEELVSRVPGFQLNEWSVGRADIFIRGLGSDLPSAAADNSVAAFIDDVYIARGTGITADIFDLERVEIIRGPAGALYGKNVIGGAISFVTRKPSREPDASVRLDVGNYNLLGVSGMVTGPLSDRVAGKLSFSTRARDGFAYNTFTKRNVEDRNSDALRGQLLFEWSESFKGLFSGDFARTRGTGNWRWTDPVTPRNAPFRSADPWSGPSNEDGHQNSDVGGASLRLDWTAAPGTLTSISAWRSNVHDYRENQVGTYVNLQNPPRAGFTPSNPNILFIGAIKEDSQTISQELRFSSDALNDRLQWVAGAYYFQEDIFRDDRSEFIFPDLNQLGGMGPPFIGGDLAIQNNTTESTAVFLEGTYRLSDSWSATASMRWNQDSKDFQIRRDGNPVTGTGGFLTPGGLGFTVNVKRSWDELTPRLSVQFEPTASQNYYLTVARGYKSGAFDGLRDRAPQSVVRGVNPELAWNYEIGAKTQWADNRLRINLAAFYIDYTDLQTQQLILIDPLLPPQRILANAGAVESKGIELELVAALSDSLRLEANYGYLDSKIADTLIINNIDLNGKTTRRSPKNKGNIALVFEHALGQGSMEARADYQYTDEYFWENDNNLITRIKSNSLLDASLRWTTESGNWTLGLWGKNLTDEYYVRHITQVFSNGYVLLGAPRTYGASFTWNYK